MRFHYLAAAAALPLVLSAPVLGDDAHAHEGHLGKVRFTNSCDAKVQPELQRAVAMLHSFWYSAGDKAFRQVLADDPGCAVATWGIASLLMNNPLAGQGASPQAAAAAAAAIEQGRRIGAKTERERDYIEAVAAYYADFANRGERARQLSRSQAYEALAKKYPDDDEAQIFAALYVAGTQSQADQTYAAYLKAAGVLEKMFVKYPDHPGVAHYLIHSYDAPPIARQGLVAARKYSDIAPDSPHALHMPSHIFTRVGAWQDSVALNRRSADVATKDGSLVDAYHAADYMIYAQLQLGRDQAARKTYAEFGSAGGARLPQFAGPYAAAAMPARLALERGDWAAASQLSMQGSAFPHVEAITAYARALGAARKGDVAAAEQDAARLESLHQALLAANNGYWATEVEVQRIAVAAWIAQAQGRTDEALRLMRGAADMEDRNEKHIVTPGRVAPARELLGEMLLELKRPADALKEFEATLTKEPNRFRAVYGAAKSASLAGNAAAAKKYYTQLLKICERADTPGRPELDEARKAK